jgi:hypothetical protein
VSKNSLLQAVSFLPFLERCCMNPITKSVDDVKRRVPRQVLEQAFKDQNFSWRRVPLSIDEQIISKVIRSRVLVDCNLVGGTEANISLDGLPMQLIDNYVTVYHVPKEYTQGRTINSVLSVGYGSASLFGRIGSGISNPASITPVTMAGQAMMDAMSPTPMVSTARATLIGENTISIRDTAPPLANAYIRVVLANDENLTHIQLRSYPAFSKLVEYAVKSFIYNELTILIDSAFLSGGQQLGRFREVVDSYADSEQNYEDYLKNTWTKVSFMNDVETYDRFIRMQVGAHR